MQLPHSLDSDFDPFIQALPDDFQEQAYQLGAFSRARKIDSPLQLLHLIMLYCGLDFSLRTCAATFAQTHQQLSDEAVKKRLQRCVPWLKSLLADVLGLHRIRHDGSFRLIVVDGSTVQERGAITTSYRLHLAIDLIDLALTQAVVTTNHEGEKLQHYTIQEGDVIIADRGYSRATTLLPVIDQGADVIVRYNPQNMALYHQDDRMLKVDWQQTLNASPSLPHVIPVYLSQGNKRVRACVHAFPLPAAQADHARRQARQIARKNGHTTQALTLYLRGWLLILSSVPAEVIDSQTIQSLYRARWQIELCIKRMKSLLKIDQLRAKKNSALAELYLYGKLLYVAVVERRSSCRFAGHVGLGLSQARVLTPWRMLQQASIEVQSALLMLFPPKQDQLDIYLHSLRERPRKRRLQTLPDDIYLLVHRQCTQINQVVMP
jgi:hypothetical protein